MERNRRRRLVFESSTGGLRSFLQGGSTTPDSSLEGPRIRYHSAESGHAAGVSGRNAFQGRNRGRKGSLVTRFLLPHVSGSQEEREVPTCNQSAFVEPIDRGAHVQNGDSLVHLGSSVSRRLGHFIGPDRWLLPRSHGNLVSEIPPVCRQRQDLPIQSPAVRSGHSPKSIYQDLGSACRLSTLSGHSVPQISRRLSGQSSHSTPASHLGSHGHCHHHGHGLTHQHSEVIVEAHTRLHLHWSQVSGIYGVDDPTFRQDREDHDGNRADHNPRPCSSPVLAVSSGSSRIGREAGAFGQTISQTHPDLPTLSVQLPGGPSDSPCESRLQVHAVPSMVVKPAEPVQRPASGSILPRSDHFHGLVHDSMGSPCCGSDVFRDVVKPGETEVYKPTRAAGSDQGYRGSSPVLPREKVDDCHRQLDHGVLHQQTRRHALLTDVGVDSATLSPRSSSRHDAQSQTYSRSSKQTRRRTQQISTGSQHRVDSVSIGMQTSPGSVGFSVRRPDGDSPHNSPSGICFSIPGPEGLGSRQSVLRLERDGRVHLSAMAHDCSRPSETPETGVRGHGHSTMLAKSTVVSGSTRVASGASASVTSVSRAAVHASQSSTSRKRRSIVPARVQAVVDSTNEAGFSIPVLERISRGGRVFSTETQYNSRWSTFSFWCDDRKISPCLASAAELADFLLDIFSQGKSYSTLTNYRTAINSVWKALGRYEGDSYCISQLMKSFRVDRPRSLVVLPKWDLALVLRVLSRTPYEPLHSIAFKNLSSKTVFLLLLATARRKGDVHAIDPKRITYSGHNVILHTLPKYIPKVRANAEGEARYAPMVVRGLASFASDAADLTLCPVRALKAYDSLAKRMVPDRPQFFISNKGDRNPVTKNTISAWVVKLLRSTYAAASDEECRLHSTSVHEVRAIASSLAFQATFSLKDVLSAASWSNPTTFTEYYLRDVSGLQGKLHVIAPCVVAGTRLY